MHKHEWLWTCSTSRFWCKGCSAAIAVQVIDTPTQIRLLARVVDVGQDGVPLEDIDWLVDLLGHELAGPRAKPAHHKKRVKAA